MTKDLVVIQDEKVVTSSLQIAEDFSKNHSHVLRDIDELKGSIQNWTTLFYEDSYIHPQNKQSYRMYYMNRDGFTLLAMGFTGKKALQFKLEYINQFNKMEEYIKNQLNVASYMIDDPIKRAEKWIEEQKQKQIIQEQLTIAQPKANKYDEFLNDEGYMSGDSMAKIIGIGRNTLYKHLRDLKVYTNNNTPYQTYMDKDLFKVIAKQTPKGNTSVTLVNAKGVDVIIDVLKRNELIA